LTFPASHSLAAPFRGDISLRFSLTRNAVLQHSFRNFPMWNLD
jgi:hypothetical protein